MQRFVNIDHDLDNIPLYIKTDSVDGSLHLLIVNFLNNAGNAGGLVIIFRDPPVYNLALCTSSPRSFPALPSDIDKVWKITLKKSSEIRLVIHCNDVEVLNVLMSDSTCAISGWKRYLSSYVDKIEFSSSDTASDFYSPHLPITPGNYFLHF